MPGASCRLPSRLGRRCAPGNAPARSTIATSTAMSPHSVANATSRACRATASASAGACSPASSSTAPALSLCAAASTVSARSAGGGEQARQASRVDPAAARMQVEMAGGELGQLGEAAGQGQARHRMPAQVFQRAADEIAHLDQRLLGQPVETLHGALRGRAGRGGDMVDPGGAGHIDAAVDRVDPRRAGIRHDNAGRPQHRQPADDAEPRVHRLFGETLAARDRDRDGDIGRRCAVRLGDIGELLADHRPRRRVDRRLADRQRQARAGSPCRPPRRRKTGCRCRAPTRPARRRSARRASRRDRRRHP